MRWLTRVVAVDLVGEPVAGAVDRRGAGQGQVLDEGAQRVAHRGVHRSCRRRRPRRSVLAHGIAGIVDGVDVVAGAAEHRVDAGAAVQLVVAASAEHVIVAVEAVELAAQAAVAVHRVGESIALSGQPGAKQLQQFQIAREGVAHAGEDRIGALFRKLGHLVALAVDHVGVVARSTVRSCRHRGRRSAGRRGNRH